MVELRTASLAALYDLSIRFPASETLGGRHKTFVTDELEVRSVHQPQAVEVEHAEAVAPTHQKVRVFLVTD